MALAIILAALISAALISDSASGSDLFAGQEAEAVFQAEAAQLTRAAQQQGKVRVIVRLELPFQSERGLSARAAQRQRDRIANIQQELLTSLEGRGLIASERFKQFPLLTLEVDAQGLQALLSQPQVAGVLEDKPIPAVLDESVPLIGADTAWSQGADGSGYLVAVLDTGVDLDHPFLAGKIHSQACFSTTSEAYRSESLCPDGSEQQIGAGAAAACSASGCDHGTHVAGIALGASGSLNGVAKGAELIAVQIFSEFQGAECPIGQPTCVLSFASDQIQALEWLNQQRQSLGLPLASINMSLGSNETYSAACDWDSREPVVTSLRAEGIAVVIASGNGGSTDGLSMPACISSSVSVGATTNSDGVASFSNVGALLDYFAPGTSIYSSVPDDSYGNKSGTSMAAPHVAGAIALLRSANEGYELEEILAALTGTGQMVVDGRSGGSYSRPRIQVDEALAELNSSPTPTPSGTPATATPTMTPTATITATATLPPAADHWYLAEGYTGAGFGTYILVQNPALEPAEVAVSYMLDSGGIELRNHQIPAQSRYTINAADEAEVGPGAAFSTLLESDREVFVERAMYFGNGGHGTIGVQEPANTWYLAEGFTGAGFSTFILIQNPNDSPATVDVHYFLEGAVPIVRQHEIAANSRFTINTGDEAEVGADTAFSTKIESDQGIIVERAMYFGNGGHDTIGLTEPADTWYLAEGYTGQGFSTFLLLQNPNPDPLEVTVSYMLADGSVEVRQHQVAAESRYTISAGDEAEVGEGAVFSTKLEAAQAFIVERAMYWEGGGHSTIGVTSPSTTWDLAEGYTGDGFSTYILLQNPNPAQATVTVSYLLPGGGTEQRTHQVPGQSRYTIMAGDEAELGPGVAFSTHLESDEPIIVERSMYFSAGGHATIGIAQ
jgi:subtilisin family serine protease